MRYAPFPDISQTVFTLLGSWRFLITPDEGCAGSRRSRVHALSYWYLPYLSTWAFAPLKPNGRSWPEVCIFTIDYSLFLLRKLPEVLSCLLPLPDAARRLQKLSSAQIPPSAKITQPRFTSQDHSARIPQPRFLRQDSSAKTPQQRFLSEDSSAKIPQPRFLSKHSSARMSAKIPRAGFLCQDSLTKISQMDYTKISQARCIPRLRHCSGFLQPGFLHQESAKPRFLRLKGPPESSTWFFHGRLHFEQQ